VITTIVASDDDEGPADATTTLTDRDADRPPCG